MTTAIANIAFYGGLLTAMTSAYYNNYDLIMLSLLVATSALALLLVAKDD